MQYREFLAVHCAALDFERDEQLALIPGQAGPHLSAKCKGPTGPPVGDAGDPTPGTTVSTGASGSGAAAATARRGLASEDAARRERRDEAREGAGPDASSALDVEIVQVGRAGAFLSLDRQDERQRATEYESGRSAHSISATVGVDYRLGTKAVAGLAMSSTDLSGSFHEGGNFDASRHGVWVYGSWFPRERMFVDAAAGIDAGDQRMRRLVGLSTITETPTYTSIHFDPPLRFTNGESSTREKGVEVSGGYDFFAGGFTYGPRAGVSARRSTVSGFVERGETPLTLAFDRQSTRSLQSSIGIQASRAFATENGALVAQLNLDWLHEFEDDQRLMTARFAEDLRPDAPRLSFLTQAPDRNWYNIRASAVATFSSRFSGFVMVATTFGHDYLSSSQASIGVRRDF